MTDFWPRGTSWSFAWRCRWRSMGVGPSGQGLLLMMHGRNLEDDTGLVRRIHISRQDASARTGSSLQLLPSVPALRHASCRQPGSTGRPPNLDNARVREARAGHGPGRSQMSFGGCVASSKATSEPAAAQATRVVSRRRIKHGVDDISRWHQLSGINVAGARHGPALRGVGGGASLLPESAQRRIETQFSTRISPACFAGHGRHGRGVAAGGTRQDRRLCLDPRSGTVQKPDDYPGGGRPAGWQLGMAAGKKQFGEMPSAEPTDDFRGRALPG
ncbi:hypothetical protein Purlil1_6509 [Purpureocillium lilacinum]|uniref:Uncharacterized protein n=1 Tax=Purpureocillium lilacinum TaxID=33203 RepID=A0ABR0BYZ1_PURLI|nr:hypothetical protein Purlil1_6509 [Purpureocillium lilacinum]